MLSEREADLVMVEIEMYETWARRKTSWYQDRAIPMLNHLTELHRLRDEEIFNRCHHKLANLSYKLAADITEMHYA